MKKPLIRLVVLLWAALTALPIRAANPANPAKPNFIVILCDNLGYGDLGCQGSSLHRTPHLDRMAAEGLRLSSFYVTSGVCTPSRASLMTGCYPRRVNMHVDDTGGSVFRPVGATGLNPQEETIAKILQKAGYATACIGKWHLGDQPEFLPTRHGFDEYFGIPYSDDMTKDKSPATWPELPLMRNEKVIEAPVDRDYLTKRYTEEAIDFITRHKDGPFFIYLPQAMPGSTAHPFASPAFKGKSRNGGYGDSVEELDWSTGEILATLGKLGLDERTLVVFTSDNGAVKRNPPQGSNAPYKGWGYDTSEGAMRMPCLLRWPGHVPAGAVSDEICTTMDFLPVFARLAGAPLPSQTIDGHDCEALWMGRPHAHSAYDDTGFFYYYMEQLQAVRAGEWKLYLPLERKIISGNHKTASAPLELYDVRHDVGEAHEVSSQHPAVVQRLLSLADHARVELGDMDHPGSGQRPAGHVEHPVPQLLKQTP
jgi:arylsulfatase A